MVKAPQQKQEPRRWPVVSETDLVRVSAMVTIHGFEFYEEELLVEQKPDGKQEIYMEENGGMG